MSARALLGLHAAQLAFLLWIAATTGFCCDADYFLRAGAGLMRDGLFFQNDFAGYRAYLVPLVFGLLQQLPGPAMPASGEVLPFWLAISFTLLSLAASRYILAREGRRRYLVFALPTLFNPFLLAHVTTPLQDGVLVLLLTPLIAMLLAVRVRTPYATIGLAVLAASLAYVIRGSMPWVAVALAIFVALEIRRDPAMWRAASRPALAAIALAIPVVLLAPQSATMYRQFGTLHPYPDASMLQAQVQFGIELLRYGTVLHQGEWKAMRSLSPFTTRPVEQKKLGFYRAEPGAGALLVLGHVWAGLHYDVLTTYFRFEQLAIVSAWMPLSAFVVAYGVLGLAHGWKEPQERSRTAFLAALFFLSCAYTAFIGVEIRHGLLGFLALSVAAARLAAGPDGRDLMRATFPLAAAYALLCIAFNAMLLYAVPEIGGMPK
jgi:hypothetical protein